MSIAYAIPFFYLGLYTYFKRNDIKRFFVKSPIEKQLKSVTQHEVDNFMANKPLDQRQEFTLETLLINIVRDILNKMDKGEKVHDSGFYAYVECKHGDFSVTFYTDEDDDNIYEIMSIRGKKIYTVDDEIIQRINDLMNDSDKEIVENYVKKWE